MVFFKKLNIIIFIIYSPIYTINILVSAAKKMFMRSYRNILIPNILRPNILRPNILNIKTSGTSLFQNAIRNTSTIMSNNINNDKNNNIDTNTEKNEDNNERHSMDYHAGNVRQFDKEAIRKICEDSVKIKLLRMQIYRDYIKHTNILRVPYGSIDLSKVAKIYKIEHNDIIEHLTQSVTPQDMNNKDNNNDNDNERIIKNRETIIENLNITDRHIYDYGKVDYVYRWGTFHRSVIGVMSNKITHKADNYKIDDTWSIIMIAPTFMRPILMIMEGISVFCASIIASLI